MGGGATPGGSARREETIAKFPSRNTGSIDVPLISSASAVGAAMAGRLTWSEPPPNRVAARRIAGFFAN